MRLLHPSSARFVAIAWLATLGPGGLAAAQDPKPAAQPAAKSPARAVAPTPSARRAAALDAGPTVMSSEAAAKLKQKYARDNRYGGPDDWRDVPAWRQASFFGLRAEGKVFIFVVDRSGSMDEGERLDRAKRELVRAIGAMQPPQRFQVIFYNDLATPMAGVLTRPADAAAKDQLARWLRRVDADGGTDPREAMALALGQRPDGVFLLSDGAFPDGTPPAIAAMNPHKVPIHCVDLAGGAGGDDLKVIARDSGGQYSAAGR